MSELLIDIFGKPHGIIIFQLVAATRFTIYLSLVAFGGGGVVAAMITFLTIFPQPVLRKLPKPISGFFNPFLFLCFYF